MIRTINLTTGIETVRALTQAEVEANANALQPAPKDAIRAQIRTLEQTLAALSVQL